MGRAAAEVLVTAFSSMAAAGLIEAAITPQRFQKIVQVSISQIKKAYRTGKAAIEEITALFTGSKNAASLLSKKLMPQAAKYLDDLVEAGVISEEVLQRSSSFLDDMLPEAEQLGTTELKTILEQAGTMENSELSDLVRWLSEKSGTKNGRALEYLDEEAKQYLWKKSTELTEKQLDDILDDIIKEVDGMEEATGVIEDIGRKSVAEKVAKAKMDYIKSLLNNPPEEILTNVKLKEISDEALKKCNAAGLSSLEVNNLRLIKNSQKPIPETYLELEYIGDHLQKFIDNGCYKIISDKRGAPNGTIGAGQSDLFVIDGEDLKAILNKANGNPRILESELAMPEGYLGDNPYLIRADNPSNLRMATGNEINAWQDEWCPAGITRTGKNEAVIDPLEKGEYSYKSCFGNDNWKK